MIAKVLGGTKVRNLLVGLDGSLYSEAATELAIRWARRTGATLTGMAVVDEPTIRGGDSSRYSEVLQAEARLNDARRRVARFLERFTERCNSAGVDGHVLPRVGRPSEQVLAEVDDFDLTLLGQRTYFHFETQESDDETLDAVLHGSHRPVVAAPMSLPAGEAVVVAFDGSRPATRALEAFQRSGLGEGQPAYVVSVSRSRREAARHAEEAASFLRFHGLTAEARPLTPSRPVPDLLVEQARALNAGTLVMGAHGRSRFREALFGSTTRAAVEQSEAVVFLHH